MTESVLERLLAMRKTGHNKKMLLGQGLRCHQRRGRERKGEEQREKGF